MAGTTRQRWWPVVVLGCVLLAGCSGTPPSGSPPSAAGEGPSAAASAPDGMSAKTGAPGALSATAGESPADKALQLEALLGQHSVLAADLMRGRIRNDDDFGQAANAAVTRNTDDLATMVGSLFGDQAATAFRGLWTDHVTALFNYSRGLATDDAAARDDAKAQLVAFENGLADFFSSASQGRLPRDAARAAVQTHVEHLTEQADAYAAKDYARSDELYRETYAHTFDLGHTLAATLLPPDQAARVGPAVVAAAVGAGPAARRARRAGRRRAARRRYEQPGLPRGRGRAQRQHQRPLRGDGHAVRRAGRAAVHVAVGRPRRPARRLHDWGRGRRRPPNGTPHGQAARLRGPPRRLPRLRHGQQDALGGSGEGIPGPRRDAHPAGRRLRRAGLPRAPISPTPPTRTCSACRGSWRTPSGTRWRPGFRRVAHTPGPGARRAVGGSAGDR